MYYLYEVMLEGIIEKASSALKSLKRNDNKCNELDDEISKFELEMGIDTQQASDTCRG